MTLDIAGIAFAENVFQLHGVAYPTCSAGQANAGATTNPELTFQPDHSVGADQAGYTIWSTNPVVRGLIALIRMRRAWRLIEGKGSTKL
ncbi:hypothetical protein [Aureimonas sp. Leaf324]|uniref:hypothetical protein n=1 Tax=Aureimonas sp. Leaf324 TaxID=1736336 RepID=UPI000A5DAEC0|nr:hypothetical protein [Aureimonas sp. Leaf324]